MFTRVFVLATLLASLAAAVSVPGLPSCAGDCVGSNFGGCQQLNVRCICTNHKLLAHLACCVSKKCSAADQEKTIQFANAICSGENVTNLPQSATCASTATGSSTTASSPTGSSTTSSTTSSPGALTTGGTSKAAGTGSAPATTATSSSQGVAAAHETAAGFGLGMVVAGLVAAI